MTERGLWYSSKSSKQAVRKVYQTLEMALVGYRDVWVSTFVLHFFSRVQQQLKAPIFLLCVVLYLTIGTTVSARDKTTDTTVEELSFFGTPFLTYAPETHFRLGAALIASAHLDSKSVPQRRASTFSSTLSLTQLKQYSITGRADLFFNNLRSRLSGRIAYERMPNRFYGYGAYTTQADEVWYYPDYLRTELMYLHRVTETVEGQGISIGARVEYSNTSMYGELPKAPTNQPEPTGWRGGVCAGLGVVATLDTRDNPYYPTCNEYVEFRNMQYLPIAGGTFQYNRTYIDARKYFGVNVGSYTPVLCAQILWDNTVGNAPFYDMPTYGGADKVRGVLAGRYVDKSSITAQLELRSQLFWVVGAAAFIGIGDVAPTFKQHSLSNSMIAGGAGLRAYLNAKGGVIGRIDVGFSEWGTGVYVSFAEAF